MKDELKDKIFALCDIAENAKISLEKALFAENELGNMLQDNGTEIEQALHERLVMLESITRDYLWDADEELSTVLAVLSGILGDNEETAFREIHDLPNNPQ